MRTSLAIIPFLLLQASLAFADDATRLQLSATATREVANDELTATLYLQDRQVQPAVLADRLNKGMARAMQDAKSFPSVDTSSGQYSTWPDYDKNGKILGWQGRAEIRLKSRDIRAASELVARLQQTLAVGSIQFNVSEQQRRKAESEMIPEAIRSLNEQAAIAAKALGKPAVSIRELEIGNSQSMHQPVMMRAKAYAAEAADVARPDLQPGQSQLQLQVSGKLEVK